jgi:hypothetical protein
MTVSAVEMSAVDTPNRTGWAMRFHIQRSDKGLQIPNRYPSVTDIFQVRVVQGRTEAVYADVLAGDSLLQNRLNILRLAVRSDTAWYR